MYGVSFLRLAGHSCLCVAQSFFWQSDEQYRATLHLCDGRAIRHEEVSRVFRKILPLLDADTFTHALHRSSSLLFFSQW